MKNELKYIALSFISWRVFLFVILYFSFRYVSLQANYLGGGMENYLNNPYLWSLANFDGEHFLAIARSGYQPLSYFFFPAYPLIIKVVTGLFANGFISYLYSGLLISHLSFLVGLVGLNKLIRLDYKFDVFKLTLLLILIFPTSFYFASVYSESIFFAICVWVFYFARKGNFLLAGLLTSVATATRVVGITLLIPVLYEFWVNNKKNLNFKNIFGLIISPIGIILYMLYLYYTTGDPLIFFNKVSIFGEQRSSDLILLPQVFYRYIFKILPNLTLNYFPVVFTTFLEFFTALFFLLISIFSFKRLRLSYWLFMVLGYIVPTLSGSFSSLPRYVLVLFPAFIYLAVIFDKKPVLRFTFFVVSLAALVVSLALFSRGYWLS